MQAPRRATRPKPLAIAEVPSVEVPSHHHVRIAIESPIEITKAPIRFEVRRDEERFGTLFVSRGAVVWKRRNGKRTYRFDWTRFDEVMQQGSKPRGK